MDKQKLKTLQDAANRLAERDHVRQEKIMNEANAYHNGYTQGLHDMLKIIEMEK